MTFDLESLFFSSKTVEMALSNFFGIGRSLAFKICKSFGISPQLKMKDLPMRYKIKLKKHVESSFTTGLRLNYIEEDNKRKLVASKCFRGIRLVKGLPTRGQRTKSNGRTQKYRALKQFKLD